MRLLTTILLAMFSFALFAQEGRNCGAMEELANQLLQDPLMEARMQAIQRHTEEFEHAHEHGHGERVVVTIPVVFHIVHNGDALGSNENLPESLILAQLEQLNQDFALLNSDASLIPALFQPVAANTEIQFCLAQRKPDGTATTGINRVNGGQASWTQHPHLSCYPNRRRMARAPDARAILHHAPARHGAAGQLRTAL